MVYHQVYPNYSVELYIVFGSILSIYHWVVCRRSLSQKTI